MTLLVDDLYGKLVTDGVAGANTGWGLSAGFMPIDPDQFITVLEGGGDPPDGDFTFPSFVVQARGAAEGYQALRTKVDQIQNTFDDAVLNGFVYIFARQMPLYLGQDQNRRPMFSVNFDSMREN